MAQISPKHLAEQKDVILNSATISRRSASLNDQFGAERRFHKWIWLPSTRVCRGKNRFAACFAFGVWQHAPPLRPDFL